MASVPKKQCPKDRLHCADHGQTNNTTNKEISHAFLSVESSRARLNNLNESEENFIKKVAKMMPEDIIKGLSIDDAVLKLISGETIDDEEEIDSDPALSNCDNWSTENNVFEGDIEVNSTTTASEIDFEYQGPPNFVNWENVKTNTSSGSTDEKYNLSGILVSDFEADRDNKEGKMLYKETENFNIRTFSDQTKTTIPNDMEDKSTITRHMEERPVIKSKRIPKMRCVSTDKINAFDERPAGNENKEIKKNSKKPSDMDQPWHLKLRNWVMKPFIRKAGKPKPMFKKLKPKKCRKCHLRSRARAGQLL